MGYQMSYRIFSMISYIGYLLGSRIFCMGYQGVLDIIFPDLEGGFKFPGEDSVLHKKMVW